MDYLRTAYSTKMRLWADRPDEVTVNWFRADPGAEVFPGPHSFTSRNWLDPGYIGVPLAIGETLAPRVYSPGINFAGLRGTNHCGRDQAFITGGVTGIDPEIPVLPDGSSACCDGVDEQDPQELLVSGSDIYGNSDDVFLIAGGEDIYVSRTPVQSIAVLVPDATGPGSHVGAANQVLECVMFSNTDNVDHFISTMWTTYPAGDPWFTNVRVPANGWICLPCQVPLLSTTLFYWADVASVLTYYPSVWLIT